MGRSRDVGEHGFATVAEAAETLAAVTPGGLSTQAIYNRINRGTIPYEQHLDQATGRASYRIPRDWLKAEVARRTSSGAATTAELAREGEARATEIIAALVEHAGAIRGELETQHTKLEHLLGIIIERQQEMYEEMRRVLARAEEEDRREREYQERNIQLQERNLELFEEMKADADAVKAQREKRGKTERRSFWRRLLDGD